MEAVTQCYSAERGSVGAVSPPLPGKEWFDAVRTLWGPAAPQGLGSIRGSPGPAGQDLAARTHHTTSAREQGRTRGSQGSPSPKHRASPWGQGQAEISAHRALTIVWVIISSFNVY